MSVSVAIIGTRGYPSYYGGFETAVRKLAPYLADAGWDVTVYGRHGATRDHDDGRDHRVRTVVTSGIESKSLSTLSYGLTAVLHAMRSKPDVALVMNVANGFWLPLLRLRGIPVVVNVDGIEWERAKWGRLAKGIFKLAARFTSWFGGTLVADAAEIQRRWIQGFSRESVFIPYGGDVPGVLPVEPGLESRSYALLVARFVPENTVAEFFDAAEVLAATTKIVIVGSSGYGGLLDERAAELARKYENVSWLGHVSDDRRLLALWQHAGAYFHGHSVGGTNPALVQAMACGAPTVARDTVYNREVLGDGAKFVAPQPEAIAAAISSLLNDTELQSSLSSTSLSRAREHYSWELVCRLYQETLVDSISAPISRESKRSPVAGKANS
ncbi:glycosyltransferase involved in cell wall biosynthesis [Arthrobacter sp. SLBN-100]|uniref:glycosyltransferase n=1 Tax=Arthrobacter sp. SLBN-100 TaxID=2768450 RepID=UPI0011526E9C|nr:glycosyltransferase [Arthrobacter sp. SLBN-100]TQJ67730.1 glycosyltransferase involved in cell wall biosynthesis [Arthrobacter sp. SLBN-100]